MAMTVCRECEQAVSERADACPRCGVKHPGSAVQAKRADQASYGKAALIGVALLVAIVLLLEVLGV